MVFRAGDSGFPWLSQLTRNDMACVGKDNVLSRISLVTIPNNDANEL